MVPPAFCAVKTNANKNWQSQHLIIPGSICKLDLMQTHSFSLLKDCTCLNKL